MLPTHHPEHETTTRREPAKPRHFHTKHHTEPDGTIHTLCGLIISRPATSTAMRNRIPCPACDIAAHLNEVMP